MRVLMLTLALAPSQRFKMVGAEGLRTYLANPCTVTAPLYATEPDIMSSVIKSIQNADARVCTQPAP